MGENKKSLVVLGAGESGVGAAILAHAKGMEVFVSDFGTIAPHYRKMLDDENIQWEQGKHSMERILAADEIVKSPGIAPTTPVMKAVIEKGIPVISEIEFAVAILMRRWCASQVQRKNHNHASHISYFEKCRFECGFGGKRRQKPGSSGAS